MSVIKPAEPIGEESQAASKHRSCAISCADSDTAEERTPPLGEAACRVNEEQRVEVERQVKATLEVDAERPSPCTDAARGVDEERMTRAETTRGVDEERPQPRAEAARGVDEEAPTRAEAESKALASSILRKLAGEIALWTNKKLSRIYLISG